MYSESLNMNIDDDKKCAHCALGNSGRPNRTGLTRFTRPVRYPVRFGPVFSSNTKPDFSNEIVPLNEI